MIERARQYLLRPAEPSETAPWWDAGGGLLTVLFWGGISIFLAALFRQKFLPFVDYPQHLSLAALLHKMATPGSPEREVFETNLLSFNSMWHVVVAGFAFLMPIERAGEMGVAVIFLLWAVAVLQLLKVTGRPRGRAFLVMPLLPCSTMAWGFCNFGMSLAIQMIVVARVIQTSRVAPRERLRYDAITCVMALCGMWAQLLGSLFCYAMMLVAILADMQSRARVLSLGRRLLHAVRLGLPLLPAVAYAAWSYYHQTYLAKWKLGVGDNGADVTALGKVGALFSNLTSFRSDQVDAIVIGAALGLLLLSGLLRDASGKAPLPARWLLPGAICMYILLPMNMWGTWYVYPRMGVVVALMALLFFPHPRREVQAWFNGIFCGIGLFTAGWFYVQLGTGREDYDDLDALLDEAPKGLKVTGLMYDMHLSTYHLSVLCHAAAYYLARDGGQLAYSFARIESLPVHYKAAKAPPDVPGRFEWTPNVYKPASAYGRYFDNVLVHTSTNADPRQAIFGTGQAASVKILSHHGRWWLLATKPQ